MKGDRLLIGEVARQAAVNVQTLRYYERRRLLEKPRRSGSGYREFPPATVRLVRFIKRAQDLGFTLTEVKGLIALRGAEGRMRREARLLAEARLRDIDRKLAALQLMRDALRALVQSCGCRDDGTACPIIEALDDDSEARERGRPEAREQARSDP